MIPRLLAAALTLAVGIAEAAAKPTMQHVTGPFDVKLIPQDPQDPADAALGRMLLDKKFHGELEAVGKGQMLTGMTEVKESGAYVAIERITGKLGGREGSFIVHHIGIMDKGAQSLVITVVPDSGTGQLKGLKGTMKIRIEAGGKHFYDFDYTIEE